MLKPVRLANQTIATQPLFNISDKPPPSTSSAGAASQYTDYDFDQQSDPTCHVHLIEEGEISDEETGTAKQEPYEVTSEA